ncbi:MAG: YraN family protein [Candidatus Hydrogenedentales bacterium]|jgi:putative endonuclease
MRFLRFLHRSEPLWKKAEKQAARYLQRKGYTLLHRNMRLGRYEVDIIVRKDDVVAFVEVRSRAADSVTTPEETIQYTKRSHLRAAMRYYLAQHEEPGIYYRFDVMGVVILPDGKMELTHTESAFTLDE